MYQDNLRTGMKDDGASINQVLRALQRQRLIIPLPHTFGRKWYLNKEKRKKIGEILKEKPRKRQSILLLLFVLE